MNPWKVENIQEFAFLNCPECIFKSKEEHIFQQHALQNHPKSSVFFNNPAAMMLTEEEIAIENIVIEKTEPIVFDATEEHIILQSEAQPGSSDNIEYFVKILDHTATQPLVEQTIDNKANMGPVLASSFHGARKKKKQSVQALIDVLDELSDERYMCVMCNVCNIGFSA